MCAPDLHDDHARLANTLTYLKGVAVVGSNVCSVGLLLKATAHQLCPLLEDALHSQLGKPLTSALEEHLVLVLLPGASQPARPCNNDIGDLCKLANSGLQVMHLQPRQS